MNKTITITKEHIVEHLRENIGFSSLICSEIVATILTQIVELTMRDDKLTLQNFGTWQIHDKTARPGFNIHTNQPVNITPRKVLRLIPSEHLKKIINSPTNKIA